MLLPLVLVVEIFPMLENMLVVVHWVLVRVEMQTLRLVLQLLVVLVVAVVLALDQIAALTVAVGVEAWVLLVVFRLVTWDMETW
jgi:hypothetical protein